VGRGAAGRGRGAAQSPRWCSAPERRTHAAVAEVCSWRPGRGIPLDRRPALAENPVTRWLFALGQGEAGGGGGDRERRLSHRMCLALRDRDLRRERCCGIRCRDGQRKRRRAAWCAQPTPPAGDGLRLASAMLTVPACVTVNVSTLESCTVSVCEHTSIGGVDVGDVEFSGSPQPPAMIAVRQLTISNILARRHGSSTPQSRQWNSLSTVMFERVSFPADGTHFCRRELIRAASHPHV
jgi:hypothetical protein